MEVASREAVGGDDLERLESDVLARFRAEAAVEQAAWQLAARLEVAALRQVRRALRPDRERRPPAMTTVPAADSGTQ
jgi:F-type H+-transporting ATPase subunit epsilon